MSCARRAALSPCRAVGLLAVIAALSPGVASAGWTPAFPVPLAAGTIWQAQAVNARGDLVVAGVRAPRPGPAASPSRVAVVIAQRRATGGAFRARTVMSARRLWPIGQLTVALDRYGAPTVAWVQRRSGHNTVVAAVRTRTGRWTNQTIGQTSAFNNTAPRVAAAQDGTVVITYYAGAGRTPGMAAAWRSRGGRFGTPQSLHVGTHRGAYLTDPTLTFDAHGTALLTGAAACGQAASTGVLYTGSARTRRFARGRVVAPSPAQSVHLALAQDRTPIIAWLTGDCTPGAEDISGTPMAATVRSGTTTTPTPLVNGFGWQLTLAGAPGGATATWADAGVDRGLLTATIRSDGTVTPAQAPEGDWDAVAASPAGDQLLRQFHPVYAAGTPPFEALAARRAETGAVEPAPIPAAGYPLDAGTATAPDGRALAEFNITAQGPAAAVWRP